MGWFSPVKGGYPSLAQIDKTLPVKSDVTSLRRGMIVALVADSTSAEGVWKLAAPTDALVYVALQDLSDPTAGFAGTTAIPHVANTATSPRITALSLNMEGEYETSEYDTSNTYVIGQALYAVNGVLTNTDSTADHVVVGYVTAPATERWINNAIAAPDGTTDPRLATRTGANKYVLRFRTAK